MRIVITEAAYGCEKNWHHLDVVMYWIYLGWHEWDIREIEGVEDSAWLVHRPNLAALFEKAALVSSYGPGRFPKKVVFVGDGKDGTLSAEAAARTVHKPLTILVENRFSDAIIVRTALNCLAPTEVRDFIAQHPEVLTFDSPGGNGEIPKVIRQLFEQKCSGELVRVIVMTDSDARVPGEISKDALSVQECCREYDLPCCVLGKRNIENYIPDEVFDTWLQFPGPERMAFEALRDLSAIQRDYFPIKKGLKFDKETAPVQHLYSDVDKHRLSALEVGFGKDVIAKLEEYANVISDKVLRVRDHSGDLEVLVNFVTEEL